MVIIKSHMGTFLKSAMDFADLPVGDKAEVAILGRSNAGKSSLINSLVQRKSTAFVSKTPGKTRLINLFEFGPNGRIVDFPGYGFAKVDDAIKDQWTEIIERYLRERSNLVGALLLVDIRRDWTDDEKNLLSYLASSSVPCLVLATKVDKIGRTERERQMQSWVKEGVKKENIHLVSSHSGEGIEGLRKKVSSEWIGRWQKLLQ